MSTDNMDHEEHTMNTTATLIAHVDHVDNGCFLVEVIGSDGDLIDQTPTGWWPADDDGDFDVILDAVRASGWTVGEQISVGLNADCWTLRRP